MTPNGYKHQYDKPTRCDDCLLHYKAVANKTNRVYYMLWEYNGKKLCRHCMRGKGVLENLGITKK